jgi:Domain of unknown function (DUF4136)
MIGASAGLAQDIQFVQKLNTDLSHATTYSWRNESPAVNNNLTVDDRLPIDLRLKAAVDRDLQAKGWRLVPSGGDIRVSATNSLTTGQSGGAKSSYALGQGTAFRSQWVNIWIYPAKGEKSLWSSRASNTPSKDLNITLNQVDRSAEKMLAPFPAAGK